MYLQVGFAFGGNLVRVIAKIMKIMTGHKIKTSVQSCKIMIEKCVNYTAEPKQTNKQTSLKRSTSYCKIPIQVFACKYY